jgi:hypothetical protein
MDRHAGDDVLSSAFLLFQLCEETGGTLHSFRGSLRDATEGISAEAEFSGLQLKPLEDEVRRLQKVAETKRRERR